MLLSDFYYKYCSIKSTGLVNCTGFLLRVLVLDFPKVPTAKCTVSIKSTGFFEPEMSLLSGLKYKPSIEWMACQPSILSNRWQPPTSFQALSFKSWELAHF